MSNGKVKALPASLRSFTPWSGEGWYEEDLDWAIPVLAFPWAFTPKDCWYALDSFARSEKYYSGRGLDYLGYTETKEYQACKARACGHAALAA